MRLGEMIWIMVILFLILTLCGALCLLIWWLWRKITLPEGAPPPKWTDLSALKSGAGKTPVVLRLIVVAVLGVLMSVPVGMIYDLIRERFQSYNSVVRELSRNWGGQQLLVGPILVVPYTIKYEIIEKVPLTEAEINKLKRKGAPVSGTKEVAKTVTSKKTAVLLPKDLHIEGSLDPELRRRGIYSVRVYTADLALSGSFEKPDFSLLDQRFSAVHWDKAQILVNLSDTKAFRGISALSLGGKDYNFVPGTKNSSIAPTGFSVEVDIDQTEEALPFSFKMSVGGSQGFFIAPVAENSTIKIKSDWPHPKYCGDGLPSRREQSDSGFWAEWEVPNLVRNYPQLADIQDMAGAAPQTERDYYSENQSETVPRSGLRLAEYIIGVDLFEPVFHYSILTRAVKYAMMFIALTFLSVLIFEIATGRRGGPRLHLAQYGLIGLGLSLFYLVLLAASEQMPFTEAYILAAGLNIAMIAGYVRAALKANRPALVVAGILIALYAALFFILRMEEYSLVSGTSLLVLAMVALMHTTRNLGHPSKQLKAEQNQPPLNSAGE